MKKINYVKVSTETIKVYDYFDVMSGKSISHREELENPKSYEVEANCVGGKEGFYAVFEYEDLIYFAKGDDGHWWLESSIRKYWLPEYRDALNRINFDSLSD